MAFCETIGVLDVDETATVSDFLLSKLSAIDLIGEIPIHNDDCGVEICESAFGSVTVMPNILPGGSDSMDLPVSFDANRRAMASSTACCLFSATWEGKGKQK